MTEFIERNRSRYGVESICSILPIAPSTYYEQEARRRDLERFAGPGEAGCGASGRGRSSLAGEPPGRCITKEISSS